MSDGTNIEWTDATWNVVNGCSVCSPGCTNCYAMKLAGTRLKHHRSRKGLTVDTKAGPVWTGETRLDEAVLLDPIRWKRPRKIFVCAHGDLFHESVSDETIDRVFAVMALAPHHSFQVLTKRSARMREYMSRTENPFERIHQYAAADISEEEWGWISSSGIGAITQYNLCLGVAWPLSNVWLGVSVEDQQRADERIPDLLATPAALRFLSIEPLLGPVDLGGIKAPREPNEPEDSLDIDWRFDCLEVGDAYYFRSGDGFTEGGDGPYREHRIEWVILGGENGDRPMHPAWATSVRDQCAAATLHGDPAPVPFLFKQWGSWAPVCAIPDSDVYYHPAPVRDPERSRRCKVATCVLQADGTRFDGREQFGFGAYQQGRGAMMMMAIGKHRSGRLLDGVQHDGMPAQHIPETKA